MLTTTISIDDVTVAEGDDAGAFVDVLLPDPNTAESLEGPCEFVFGPDGNMYVADINEVLRYDMTTGDLIDAFVPSDAIGDGAFGLAFSPLDNNLYVANWDGNEVLRYQGPTGPTPGAFIDAFIPDGRIDKAANLLFDGAGTLYVSSIDSDEVLHYDAHGNLIDVVVSAVDGLDDPFDLVFDDNGGLLVASSATSQILRYDIATGTTSVFVPAGSGGLAGAQGLEFGVDGHLYVGCGNQVLRYDGSSGAFDGIFVPSKSAGLMWTGDLMFAPDGDMYVGSYAMKAILKFDGSTGTFLDYFALSPRLTTPRGVEFGPDDSLYVSNWYGRTVKRYDGQSGTFIEHFVSPESGGTSGLAELHFGPDGNLYAVNGVSIVRFNGSTGAFIDTFIPAGEGGLDHPREFIFHTDGMLYVSSRNSESVLRFDSVNGQFIDVFVAPQAGGLDAPTGIAFGPDGNLYVLDRSTGDVFRYNGTNGAFLDVFAAGDGQVVKENVDSLVFGPDGDLYVMSSSEHRVLRYDGATGEYIGDFVSPELGGLFEPYAMAFDSNGSLYVADQGTTAGGHIMRYAPASHATFRVTLSNPSATFVTVDYATSNGTAGAGSDFTTVSGTLTFAPGETSKTIIAPTIDDGAVEGEETFSVTLSNATGGATIDDGDGVATISDNDEPVVTTDPMFSDQWALDNTGQTGGTWDADIDAPAAWAVTTGSTSTVVAVLDTGIDYTHEDLYLNIWLNQGEIPSALASSLSDTDADGLITFRDLNDAANAGYVTDVNGTGYIDAGDLLSDSAWEDGIDADGNGYTDDLVGWDWVNNDNDPMDTNSHGTMVAGLLGAVGDNGVGIAGVTWGVQMMPLKFKYDNPTWTVDAAVGAIDYAVDKGAPISSNSWGDTTGEYIQEIYDAIDRARLAGHLFVASAGNSARDTDTSPRYPANYDLDNIISVAAINHENELASFSNWGATGVDLAAPSPSVLTTYPGNQYGNGSGTSAATPHVAGVAALLHRLNPGWEAPELKGRILSTVDPLASLVGKTVSEGTLNAAGAVADTSLHISDPSVIEGNSGTSSLVFAVTRRGDTTDGITLNWSTEDGTATAGSDYSAASGQVVFSAGETQHSISVTVNGDTDDEDNETLLVTLDLVSGTATIADPTAQGTILNDDTVVFIGDVTVTEGDTTIGHLGPIVSPGGITRAIGMEFDTATGMLYMASATDSNVLRYDTNTGEVTELIPPNSNGLSTPRDIVIGPDNSLYVASGGTDSVLRFGLDGTFLGTFVQAGSTGLDFPAGLVFDDADNLYVTSFNTDEVFVFDDTGTPVGDGVFIDAAANGGMDKPTFIAFDDQGILYVTDRASQSVLRFDSNGTLLGSFGETGTSGLSTPLGLAFSPTDGDLYVASFGNDQIMRFDGDTGTLVDVVVDGSSGAPDGAADLVFDQGPNLYASGYYGNEVQRYGALSQAAFPVTLAVPSQRTITVDFSTSDVSATAGSDYSSASGILTFLPGETLRTIVVPTIDDTTIESVETFVLNLSNPSEGASLTDDQGVGTILDDDQHRVLVTPSSGLVTAEYGVTAEFDVVLGRAPVANVTIDLSSSIPSEALISTASSGSPAANLSMTFAPQDWDVPQKVTVTGIDDGVDDGDTPYTIVLSAATSSDPDYAGVDPDDVSGTNFEFESIEIQVEAYIDGRDQLILQGNTAQWHHFDAIVVRSAPTIISTTLNGHVMLDRLEWYPEWPDASGPTDPLQNVDTHSLAEDILAPALPNTSMDVALEIIESREAMEIIQSPSAANDYTTVLEFDDIITGGAAWYKARLTFAEAYEPELLFVDSFENGEWDGKWVEDSQYDWFDSTQRETDGSYSAEVDGRATDATLTMAQPVDMTPYGSAELTFDWYIESGFDSGEYLALDFSSDDSNWTEIKRLRGNVDQENTWHHETIELDPAYQTDNFKIRYRAYVSRYNEDANVDNVQLWATSLAAPPNYGPVASNDAYSVDEDDVLTVAGPGVLDNDTDQDLDPLTAHLITDVSSGALALNANGSFTYTPNANFNGTDNFTYQAFDGTDYSNTATVMITVNPVNDAPVANDHSPATDEDIALAITLTGSDVDGDSLTFTVVGGPSNGVLSGTAPNLTYTPAADFNGADSFTYKVNDGTVYSDVATISITVNPVNDTPEADPQSVSTAEDTARAITLTGSDIDGDPLTYSIVIGPTDGILSGTAPNLTYTPAADFNGSDSFAFVANDGTVDSAAAVVSITITPENDAPVANGQAVNTAEDTAKAITLTGSDVDGDALTYIVVSDPAHGMLTGTAPSLTYTPDGDYNGSDSFTFKVNDGTVDSGLATVNITIDPVNDAPTISDIVDQTTDEDTATGALAFTIGDLETSPDLLTVSGDSSNTTLVPSGNIVFGGSGANRTVTVTPADDQYGTATISVTVDDGTDTTVDTFLVTVSAANDAPVADDQSLAAKEDTDKAITLTASDVDGDSLGYSVVTSPTNGSLSGTAPNLTYTPNTGYTGPDSFTFKANDGTVDSNEATVSITVAENNAPVADPQSVSADEDSSTAITLTGSDPDEDPISYELGTPPQHGTLSGTIPNYTYTPNADFNGSDSFTFIVNDGTDDSAEATVSITVNPVNDIPTADGQSQSTDEDIPLAVTLTGSDIDGDSLTFLVVDGPSNGTLSGTVPNLTYTPDGNFHGADSFTFKVNDGTVDSALATVVITVNSVNDAPVADAQSVSTPEDTAKAITLTGSDVDGDALTYTVVTDPSSGSLSGTAPNLTYTPNGDFHSADSFTFKVNDGTIDSAVATVDITISPVNDAPGADSQSVSTSEDTAKPITLTASDIDGDGLLFAVATPPSHGSLSGSGASLTYTPDADYHGSDSFTFVANDGTVDSAEATVSITIASVNDAPVADAQSVTTDQDTVLDITLTASDVDGESLSFAVVTPPGNGTLSGAAPDLTYTPDPGHSGPDSFTFVANDGSVDSAETTITIDVTPVASGPKLSHGVASNVGSNGWTDVDLGQSYTSMVVIATPNYDSGDAPGVVRIQNADSSSFQVRVDPAGGADLSGVDVHYVVVEEGEYTVAEHGVKMEAVKFTSTVTDENNSWVGEPKSYANSYSNPVVLGQVMTYNDPAWSVFWACGSNRSTPPTSSALKVGKHVGEDSDTTRANETIGYIVLETSTSGTAEIEGLRYVAALGGDSIRGVDNGTGYNYSYSAMPYSKAAVVTMAAMDGGNGGWAVLYGNDPITPTGNTLKLVIDEDRANDSERKHTTEQVAYLIIDPPIEAASESSDPLQQGPYFAFLATVPQEALADRVAVGFEHDLPVAGQLNATAVDTAIVSDSPGIGILARPESVPRNSQIASWLGEIADEMGPYSLDDELLEDLALAIL
uniref:Serine proteinase protein n=1 Tax=uncultured bacterium ws156A7 TaxID=1131828 RepID=I1X4T0_9BACT|nr:serine proteinase precursor protein [uncultured bacterium ws156A7]